LFPPGPLYDLDDLLPKPTWIIEPPPEGKAVVISTGFSRVLKGEALLPSGVRELGYTQLRSGEYVVVFARPIDFDYQEFRQRLPQLLANFTRPKMLTSEEHLLNMRNPRLFIVNDPKADGYLKLMDIPVTISRA
jgi:hypothetical protein